MEQCSVKHSKILVDHLQLQWCMVVIDLEIMSPLCIFCIVQEKASAKIELKQILLDYIFEC